MALLRDTMRASGALVGNGEFTGNWPASSEIDVSTNSSGDVYVIGDFRGIVDFDPGAGVLVDTSTFVGAVATSDIFVAKYNASLAYQWQVVNRFDFIRCLPKHSYFERRFF